MPRERNWHESMFRRKVRALWPINSSTKIGGPGKIVEIDESKFGKRKAHCGRLIDGTWVFGGIERDSKRVFMTVVPNRSFEVLLQVLQEWVLDGTTIYSDCWKSYDKLAELGFEYHRVNHSLHFVEPETGTHTQNIERLWRDAKDNVPRYGRRTHHMVGHLAAYLFRRCYPRRQRLHHFVREVATLYPPSI